MKKILILVLLTYLITSCGPKRLGCGPSRCSIEKTIDQKAIC